ncbi:hypothetical protein PM082_008101 [Marasmius tenuissimus]|nr:hypothetical protein PM082_008101 [Marasmius tenuissimus]
MINTVINPRALTTVFENDAGRLAFLVATTKNLEQECMRLKNENEILKEKVLQLTAELDSRMTLIEDPYFSSLPSQSSHMLSSAAGRQPFIPHETALQQSSFVAIHPRGILKPFVTTGSLGKQRENAPSTLRGPSMPSPNRVKSDSEEYAVPLTQSPVTQQSIFAASAPSTVYDGFCREHAEGYWYRPAYQHVGSCTPYPPSESFTRLVGPGMTGM